MPLIQLKQVCL